MNNAYRDVIYETKYQMPLMIIIDDVNICDNLTIEFIKYYLSNECNDLLFITLNSIPIYPPYVYLEPVQKDPFCDLKDNKSIAKFSIELLDTDDKKIILITDGGENCGGNPCAFARNLMKKRNDIHIDVVLASSSSNALTCLASTTGGHLYHVNNLSDFTTTMTKSMQSEPATLNEIKKQNYEFISD